MKENGRFGMRIVTAELFLDDLLTTIFNGLGDAQKPIGGTAWSIRTQGLGQNSLQLDSKWGGCLYEG